MFVMTARLSRTKLLAAILLILAAILLVVLLVGSGGGEDATAPAVDSNDARVAYLATYGWSVDAEPKQTQQVRIPEDTENRVFARYNELQISQGFDLTQYAGKEVTRYVYEILNYPDATAPVYASLLIYNGQVIGGDITGSGEDGIIHGFERPASLPQPTQEEATQETMQETTQPDGEAEQ